MLDMGFEPQLRKIVTLSSMTKERQTLMFSATFADNVQEIARQYLKNVRSRYALSCQLRP